MLLFSAGFFLVAITIIHLQINFHHGQAQINRTTWASVEAFAAAFVANVPTLYTLRRKALSAISSSSYAHGSRLESNAFQKVQSRTRPDDSDPEDEESKTNRQNHIVVTKSIELVERQARAIASDEESWESRARRMRDDQDRSKYGQGWNRTTGSEDDLVCAANQKP